MRQAHSKDSIGAGPCLAPANELLVRGLVELIQPLLNGLNSLQNNFDPLQGLLCHAVRVVNAAGHRYQCFSQ